MSFCRHLDRNLVKTEVQNKSCSISAQKRASVVRGRAGELSSGIQFYQRWAGYILRTGQREAMPIRGHTKRLKTRKDDPALRYHRALNGFYLGTV